MTKFKQVFKFITIIVMAGCTSSTIVDKIDILNTIPVGNYIGVYIMLGMALAGLVYSWTLPEPKEDEKN